MLSVTHAFGERLRRSMAIPPFKIRGQPTFQSLAIYKIEDRFLNPTLESKQIGKATQFCIYFLYRNRCFCTGPKKGVKNSKIARNRDLHQDRGIPRVSPTELCIYLDPIWIGLTALEFNVYMLSMAFTVSSSRVTEYN